MMATDPLSRQRAREEAELEARVGLGVKMLTNAGYAMIGGTFFKAITEDRAPPPLSYVWAAFGVAFLALALYVAPMGSRSHE